MRGTPTENTQQGSLSRRPPLGTANAGLLLPATLARHLGLPELVRQRLDLGDAPGRANFERQDDDAGGVCAGWGRLH